MKYFIDTEFIEGFHKPLLGKRRHFIDLISIGIVCEDGREYYAVSNEYRYSDADEWVKKNVILTAYKSSVSGDARNQFDATDFHHHFGKSNSQIASDITNFIYNTEYPMAETAVQKAFVRIGQISPVFYGYYADYDWVLFCSLFGRMIDLPKGFPMYCRDLKQMMDEKGLDAEWKRGNCPDPEGEHNALVDAKFNRELYNLIEAA